MVGAAQPAPGTAEDRTARSSARRLGMLESMEALALILLRNRYLWLAPGLAAYFFLQFSLLQWCFQRFAQDDLMALFAAVIELTLLAAVLIMAAAVPQTVRDWQARHQTQPLNHMALGLATALCTLLVLALEVGLAAALGGSQGFFPGNNYLPLALLQRGSLLAFWLLTVYNAVQLLHAGFRLPLPLSCLCGLFLHVLCGYSVTRISYGIPALDRLNDVFMYNLLQTYIPALPKLAAKSVFHNVGTPFLAYEITALVLLWSLTFSLWVPYANRLARRETP
jgi:hypothetical protein